MRPLLFVTASALALATAPTLAAEGDTDSAQNVVASGGTGIRLKFSGQVNRGVLLTDDGDQTDAFFVDNDNSSTRFRFTGDGDFGDGWSAGVNIEIQAESNSTATVNQITSNTNGSDFLTERKLEFYFANDAYGRLTLGQGDTASNGTSEVDLSSTAIVAYSSVSDLAGGILFRQEDGTLSTVNIGSAFSNLDGLSRQDRIRYDTPTFGGFVASVSAGSDGLYDVALRYDGDHGDFRVGSAIAYSINPSDDETVNGSVSVLHKTTGLSLTVAAGTRDQGDSTDLRDSSFGYIKAGYQTNGITSLGKTSFSVDYGQYDDFSGVDDEATSYGLAAVQHIDRISTDLYFGIRNYELDRPGTEFEDVLAVLAGARLKF
ncbi:MAG: porin [Litoreibacter sp.]